MENDLKQRKTGDKAIFDLNAIVVIYVQET